MARGSGGLEAPSNAARLDSVSAFPTVVKNGFFAKKKKDKKRNQLLRARSVGEAEERAEVFSGK